MPRKRLPARLYLRPDERTWIIRDGTVERRTGCAEHEREAAESALVRYLQSRPRRGGDRPAYPHELSVSAVLARYVDDAADRVQGRETLASNVEALARFWGRMRCDAVKGSTCRAYLAERSRTRTDSLGRRTSAGPSTVWRELGVLQAALNHAHREGLLIHPIAVELPPAGEARDRWLTRDEVARLLRHAAPHLRRFILLSVYTGRRMSAVLGLTWARVDLDQNVLRFKLDGIAETKKRRGSVRIPRQLRGHLDRWRRGTGPGDTHVVMFRGRAIESVKKALADAREAAGLDEGVTAHALKHTAITWAIMRGLSVESAAEYFHTSPATIRSHYWHHSPFHQAEAVAIMERRR